MEAEGSRLAHRPLQQHQLALPSPGIPGLDVVRALHQTVISLRTALDSSRAELRRLREIVGDFRGENYADAVERLSLENHVLRRRILDGSRASNEGINDETAVKPEPPSRSKSKPTAPVLLISEPPSEVKTAMDEADNSTATTEEINDSKEMEKSKSPPEVVTDSPKPSVSQPDTDEFPKEDADVPDSISLRDQPSNQDLLDVPDKDPEDVSLRSVSDGDNSVFSDNPDCSNQQQLTPEVKHVESENESEELDDIELIFTTEETCSRDVALQEDLVSITEAENWQTTGQPVLLKYTKSTEEPPVCNGEKTGTSSVEEAVSSQSSSIDREESIDRFDESSSTRLNRIQCSVLVETDISKCGVVEETDSSTKHNVARRNTLAAPPAYRPVIYYREAAAGRRKSSTPLRPVTDRTCGERRESGAQTDISALPARWSSETYLARKVSHTYTTLPSKFPCPAGIAGKIKMSDKASHESRRTLLSDINFTGYVPELSRSADHLGPDAHSQNCYNYRGFGVRTTEPNRRESVGSPAGYWPRGQTHGLPSPCDCQVRFSTSDFHSARYRGSLTSIPSPGLEVVGGVSRRHSWRANAASFDTWRVPAAAAAPRPTYSMPSSPTHTNPPSVTNRGSKNLYQNAPKRTRSKVTFQECPMIRGSMPNLRSDLIASENSGDSTESLIDEAEDYLRRSFDSMLTISSDHWSRQSARRKRTRRYSEPDLFREWNPPQDARPYLPKHPRELKLDHLVKVISPEGRVLQGKVRYIGPVPGREEVHVGVELPTEAGSSDGTFHGRRFFDCEPDRAIFVPYKKVVLAWCTT